MKLHEPENADLQPNEKPEVKAERREMVASLTEQFLSQGGAIKLIPTGKSARKLRGIKSKDGYTSPTIVVEGDEDRTYARGQHPESSNSWIFPKKEAPFD